MCIRDRPWVQAEEVAYAAEDWDGVIYYGTRAVAIEKKSDSYINEDKAWGAYPWDAMAYAYYRLGDLGRAEQATLRALAEEPGNERMLENLAFFRGGGGT